ncbi:class I SAM-dependent methyltransferase [Microvirga guangxiensis]|uniref:Methyltransferase domain-containing protein n=1 Tax=Microvirga guangxiensis TaxID=549386 RepID=A0A1G5LBH4_9HYPH|nr:methyltransferase domain-containing protein [Microvirga guangxiensis]SCZ10267.1 Methyltransferase domain-containing protein [Microvirga guangxiensis]
MAWIVQPRWSSGEIYESYVGRWSRLVAREFIPWLGAPPGLDWLDVGCGTGMLTQAIAEQCIPERLAGIDASGGFLEVARQRLSGTAAELQEADAQDLPFTADEFDRVVSGLMLNFVPDKEKAAAEMARVARSGGEVALYVWDYTGKMEMMRRFWDAAAELNPYARELQDSWHASFCQPEPLQTLLEKVGLRNTDVRAIDVPTVFRDFDDYWTPFLAGQSPAPAYCMSLSEEERAHLRERLRETLPTQPDGSIPLTARAWAVRGSKP